MGDISSLMWKEYMDLLARKGGADGSRKIALLDTIRRNMGASVMPFKLSSALVQLTSFADGVSVIGAEYMTKGANNVATSKAWRKFIWDNFAEIKNTIGDDPAYIELDANWLGNLAQKGFAPLKALDGMVRTTVVAGAYEKLMDEAGLKVDLNNPNKEMILKAERLTRKSQGSSFFKDQPLAITQGLISGNRSFDKTILQFQSFMLHRWDNIVDQLWREGIQKNNPKAFLNGVFWLLLVAGGLEQGLRGLSRAIINLITGNDDDDRDFWDQFALNTFQNVPIFGSLAGSIVYNSNPIPAINTAESVISGTGSFIKGKTPSTKLKGLITAVGGASQIYPGIPGMAQATEIAKKAVVGSEKKETNAFPGLPSLPKLPKIPKLPKTPKIPKIRR
jgi:hypothetical protein